MSEYVHQWSRRCPVCAKDYSDSLVVMVETPDVSDIPAVMKFPCGHLLPRFAKTHPVTMRLVAEGFVFDGATP